MPASWALAMPFAWLLEETTYSMLASSSPLLMALMIATMFVPVPEMRTAIFMRTPYA